MKVVIYHNETAHADLASRITEWLSALEAEHEDYYGKPHGYRTAPRFEIPAGFVSPEKAAELMLTLTGEQVNNQFVGGWITSAGNLTLVGQSADNHRKFVEYRDGRRHGCRRGWPVAVGDTYRYIETNRPDLHPEEFGPPAPPEEPVEMMW